MPTKSLHRGSLHVNPGTCANCGCGASMHSMINLDYHKLPNEIIDVLYRNMFCNDNLNFNGIYAVFCVENASKTEILNLFNFIKEAGFLVRNNITSFIFINFY